MKSLWADNASEELPAVSCTILLLITPLWPCPKGSFEKSVLNDLFRTISHMSRRPLPLSSSVLSILLVICPSVSLLTSMNVLYAKKMITNTKGMYLKEDMLFLLRKSK